MTMVGRYFANPYLKGEVRNTISYSSGNAMNAMNIDHL